MEVKGVETREILLKNEDVLIVHPDDDGNDGGYFSCGDAIGQEIWIQGISPDFMNELKSVPELAEERGVLYSTYPGAVGIGADYVIHLAQRRDEVLQRYSTLHTNALQEHGPSIERAKIEVERARSEELSALS